MKQHITPEQLEELSDNAYNKLKEWCIEHIPTDEVIWQQHKGSPHQYLLNIGQMIEFLNERSILEISGDKELGYITFQINAKNVFIGNHLLITVFCDLLWDAVKDKL